MRTFEPSLIKNNRDQNSAGKAAKPAGGLPSVGGAKVKGISDLSPISRKLLSSLQIFPEKVLDELGGLTETELQSRLLRASQSDLDRWK
jgi:hypothetical protein